MARPREASKGALILINKTDFTASNPINISNCFSSNYINYKVLVNINSSSANTGINFRLGNSGSFNSSANYRMAGYYVNSQNASGAYAAGGGGTINGWFLTGVSSTFVSTIISADIFNPFESQRTGIVWNTFAGDGYNYSYTGLMTVTTSYADLQLSGDTGNITGSISIYGYRK